MQGKQQKLLSYANLTDHTHCYLSWDNLGTLSNEHTDREHYASIGKKDTLFKDREPHNHTLSRSTYL